MRYLFAFLAVCLFAHQAGTAGAEESLFSQVPIDSVFTPPGESSAANSGANRPLPAPPRFSATKSFSLGQVAEGLREAGFDAKELDERTLSTKAKADTWSFPVIITASEDQKQLWVVLMLSVIKDEKQVPADKLLALMSANRQYAPAYFSYSAKHKRTELYRSFNSQEVTSDLLKEEINKLASIAKETQSLWSFASTNPPAPPATTIPSTTAPPAGNTSPAGSNPVAGQAPTPPVPGNSPPPKRTLPAPAAPASPSLVGKWSAAPSDKEAFAMQLDADGKFVLVNISQGKQTRSTGKYTYSNQQLTLVGDDGTRLAGSVSSSSPQSFTFKLQAQGDKVAALAFRKAK